MQHECFRGSWSITLTGECFFRPSQDNCSDSIIALKFIESIANFCHELIAECIERLFSIQLDQTNIVALASSFNLDHLVFCDSRGQRWWEGNEALGNKTNTHGLPSDWLTLKRIGGQLDRGTQFAAWRESSRCGKQIGTTSCFVVGMWPLRLKIRIHEVV